MGKKSRKDLQKQFIELESSLVSGAPGANDGVIRGTALLGQAIIKLDRTSSYLTWVLVGVGVFQIIIMLWHK